MNPPPDAVVRLTITTEHGTIEAWVERDDGFVARAHFAVSTASTYYMLERSGGDVSHRWYAQNGARTQAPNWTAPFVLDLRRAATAALAMVGAL